MIFNQIIIKYHSEDKEKIKIAEEKIREDLKIKLRKFLKKILMLECFKIDRR